MRNVEEIVKLISKLYKEEFGGKKSARFYIPIKIFRRMADRKRLEDTTKKNIINTAYEEGLIVTDHGDGFSVIEESVMLNYRKVTERVLEKIPLRASKSKK